jgi:hypothetical protein
MQIVAVHGQSHVQDVALNRQEVTGGKSGVVNSIFHSVQDTGQ